jgi:hypothetical protein
MKCLGNSRRIEQRQSIILLTQGIRNLYFGKSGLFNAIFYILKAVKSDTTLVLAVLLFGSGTDKAFLANGDSTIFNMQI